MVAVVGTADTYAVVTLLDFNVSSKLTVEKVVDLWRLGILQAEV